MKQIAIDANKKNNNVLILAHRINLINQHKELFEDIDKNMTRIESVFTEKNHLGEYGKVDLIIIDEAHLSGASSYHKICDYYKCPIIGFTATCCRLDGKPLDLFDTIVQGISTRELIKKGNIADFDYYAPDLHINFDDVNIIAGEYNNEQLTEKMCKPTIYGDILKYYKQLSDDRQGIAYCTSVKHSKEICNLFNKNGISAKHIDSSTKEKEREQVLQEFKENKFKILCNCNLISEGITLPNASVGLLLRKTMSTALFIQQSCRVLTPTENKKSIIIDFVNNVEMHGLPDEERIWSLIKPLQKREIYNKDGLLIIKSCPKCYKTFKGNLKQCPYCGYINEPKASELKNIKEIELKKINEEEARQKRQEFYQRKKEIWQCKTMSELVQYAREHNYSNPGGWAYYIMKSRKEKKSGVSSKTKNRWIRKYN